jgi:hypothetical protein
VTDLPRRSYPLVVAPPGGFEDAVRRGRRRRRKQTGGSSAAVLVLVGALAYSVVGHPGGGSDRLDQTHQPRIGQSNPLPYGGTSTPAPFASTAAGGTNVTAPGSNGGTKQGGGSNVGTAPTSVPRVSHPATKPPHPNGQAYWPRPEVHFEQSSTNLDANCLPAQDLEWCTTANGTANGTYYHLTFSVCRSAVTGEDGVLNAHRKVPVDFKTVYVDDNDTVWTYSLGQAIVPQAQNVEVRAGECVQWWVDWDGYDDFGYLPPKGSYTVTGVLFSDEHLDPATSTAFEVN